MIYGASNIAGWGPGPYIGRAVSERLTGPWIRNDQPVLTTGSKGEWDSYYIFPGSLLTAEDGTYMMYYSGGPGFDILSSGAIGLATSEDGITWKKFDDPSTKEHPYAESDPVLVKGRKGEWDEFEIWTCSVIREGSRFEAYFCGSYLDTQTEHMSLGHAASENGIHWTRYKGNPILKVDADPFGSIPDAPVILECAQIIFRDSLFFLYYDYGGITGNIGVATGRR
jgi:hypothetical protein